MSPATKNLDAYLSAEIPAIDLSKPIAPTRSGQLKTYGGSCPSRNSYPRVAIMQSGQTWCGDDGLRALDGSS